MVKSSITEEQRAYILRTRQAREAAEKGRPETAATLGIHASTYANFEVPKRNRPMPQEYIAKFCSFTQTNEKWLLTGQGPMTGGLMSEINKLNAEHLKSIEIMISAYLREQGEI